MFGYDSLWPYNARARLCAPPTTTAASWGDRRSAALAASPARAASNAPRHALLRPHGEPPAAAPSGRVSAHGRIFDAATEARAAARGSPPSTTTAASWGDPRL